MSKIILGIDEVGRGPWAGPLVIGAVILGSTPNRSESSSRGTTSSTNDTGQVNLPSDTTDQQHYEAEAYSHHWLDQLTDSKKLTSQKRAALSPLILKRSTATSLGWVSAQEIDRYGLANSLKLAARRAVKQILTQKVPFNEIIIDGTINFLSDTPLSDRVTLLKKADLLVKEVSAASIIAKVARDNYMIELAQTYPEYGFERHVGYGTAAHKQALLKHGVCPEHRRSFRPIQEIIQNYGTDVSHEPLDPALAENIYVPDQTLHTSIDFGQHAESAIATHLETEDHTIIARNYKTRDCEIDIVSTHQDKIYFTEVKYRHDTSHGNSLQQVTPKKLQQMHYAAQKFLSTHPEYHQYQPVLAAAGVSGRHFHIDDWFPIA